ncbi:hypothetical protein [Bradyrhizobium sp. 166]|nr:hypothetical protein [Bradyrhizobium sp. 166]
MKRKYANMTDILTYDDFFRRVIGRLRIFLWQILAALFTEPAINPA